MYSDIASKINSQVNTLNSTIAAIKSINLSSVWKGAVHDKLVNNLNSSMAKMNDEILNLSVLVKMLNKLQEYRDKKLKKIELEEKLRRIPDEKENYSERSHLESEIEKIVKELNNLKVEINNLNSFNKSKSEYEVVNYAVETSEYKGFTYLVDFYDLCMLNENKQLVSFGENETLYNHYTEEEVLNTLNSIKEKYSGREAAVNCTLAMMQMAANVGKKLKYGGSRDFYDIGIRSDCSVFASWAVNQGTLNGDFTKKNVIKLYTSGETYKTYEEAQPGDVLIHFGKDRSEYHATFLIKNDVENKKVVIAEASSYTNGVRVREMSYNFMKSKEYEAVNMSKYYE